MDSCKLKYSKEIKLVSQIWEISALVLVLEYNVAIIY